MGSTRDVMELFAERDIRWLFSEYNGWKVAPVSGSRPAGCIYRASRGKWGGEEVAFIAVSFDPVPRQDAIDALNGLSDRQGSRTKKYLLTPQVTDTSGILPHIRILPMNAFAFADGKLVWLTKKKNAKRFVPEPAVAMVTAG
jgi:hypothetical protein